ncbi:oligosaccharide flippase family protein [Candidatus Peregrinibacteria bacterium]|nr:oligosaccharide flippase family protein [Candidatus Peregrinibacteria bacterium]
MSQIARKILWNTGSQIIAKAILAFIGFATVKVITNYLGDAEGYGNYTAVYDFIALFGIASDLGLYTIAVREMSRDESQIEKIIGNILSIRTILAITVMLIAFGTSFFYARPDSTILFPLAAAITAGATIIMLISGTISSVLQVHYKMQYNAAGSVLGKLIAFGYMLYVIFMWQPDNPEAGFYQLLVAGIIGNLAMLIFIYFHVRRYVKLRYQFDWQFMKDVIVKSLPYGLALILNNLYFRIGSIMLYTINGPEQAGLYGVPLKVLEAIAIVPLYFMNSVLPTLTKTIKEKSETYKKVIQYSFDALVMGGTSMAIGTAAISFQVVVLLSNESFLTNTSEGFYGSDIVLAIIIFALAFSFINTLFGFILVAINKQSKLLYINGIGALIAVGANLFLIPILGARGAAITDIVVELVVASAAYFFAKKYLDFKIKLGNSIKILFAGLVMGAVVYYLKDPSYHWLGLQNKNILLLIPLGAFVYISLLFIMRVITKDMINMIRKKN